MMNYTITIIYTKLGSCNIGKVQAKKLRSVTLNSINALLRPKKQKQKKLDPVD